MDNDTRGEAAANEPEQDFNEVPWTALLGVRAGNTIATAGKLELRFVLSPVAMLPDDKGGNKANMDDPAVHFADWFERHKQDVVNLWSEAYSQRMNLVRMAEARKPGAPPSLALVDTMGQRLSTETTQ